MPSIMIMNKKCTACHACEEACSRFHEDGDEKLAPRLHITEDPELGIKGLACLQTGCGKCAESCPEDAIEKLPIEVTLLGRPPIKGFVLKVNEDKCTDCGVCYDECPTGVIKKHPKRDKAFKCDLCGGTPQCHLACQEPNPKAVMVMPDMAPDDD